MTTNICFDCKNSVPDLDGHGCPWSRNFEPVPGWTAEPVILSPSRKYERTKTYHITACPLFDPDDPEQRRAPNTAHPVRVRCIETGVVYNSLHDAATAFGGHRSNISHALKSKNGYIYGYHWEVVEEEGAV